MLAPAVQGHHTRRLAVGALGEAIAAQLRLRNVLPTTVLIAAAVEAAAAGLPAAGAAQRLSNGHSTASGAGVEAAASSSKGAAVGGVRLEAVQAAADWLAGELELRGAAVMRPRSAQ